MTTPNDRPERPARAVPQPNAVVGVGLVVADAEGRVLLGQAHDGRWELPGGKVDPGESFEQAAARELAEETDLRVAPEDVRILTVQLSPKAGVTRLTAGAVTTSAEGTPGSRSRTRSCAGSGSPRTGSRMPCTPPRRGSCARGAPSSGPPCRPSRPTTTRRHRARRHKGPAAWDPPAGAADLL